MRSNVHCHVEAAMGIRPALVVSTYEGEGSSGSSPEVSFQHCWDAAANSISIVITNYPRPRPGSRVINPPAQSTPHHGDAQDNPPTPAHGVDKRPRPRRRYHRRATTTAPAPTRRPTQPARPIIKHHQANHAIRSHRSLNNPPTPSRSANKTTKNPRQPTPAAAHPSTCPSPSEQTPPIDPEHTGIRPTQPKRAHGPPKIVQDGGRRKGTQMTKGGHKGSTARTKGVHKATNKDAKTNNNSQGG